MSTALELVNRIRAKRRDATSSVITDKSGVAYLDFLNSAITTVLEERTWSFQQRSDGKLYTVADQSGTAGTVTAASTTFSTAFSGTTAQVSGSFQARLVIEDDAAYGHTSFRLATASVAGGTLTGALADAWVGSTNAGAANWHLYVWEYQLPSTVRSVTNVSHQESEISLVFEDGQYTFDRLVPTPFDEVSDQPQFVMVGGEIQATASSGTGAFGLGLRIYPVPDTALVFDYSYIYLQPKLTVLTDTTNRVPNAVEDLIVELATARVISSLEKDVQSGLPLEVRVMREIERVYKNHMADSGRRSPMRSLDHIGQVGSSNWPPRTVTGLSGS